MALIRSDRVKETTTTTGTGALTLAGAITGYRAFSAVMATNDTCWYALQAVDASGNPTGDWEVGLGTYNTTLTRTTIYASSNSGSAVSLAAGTKQVWITLPASKFNPSDGTFDTSISGSFSWVNQGGATLTTVDGGQTLFCASAGASDAIRARVITAPSTPYQIVARIDAHPINANFLAAGLLWRDSASGKIQTWGLGYRSTASPLPFLYLLLNWNSATSFNADQTTKVATVYSHWHRIRDDGTNRYADVSSDGVTWVNLYSMGRTTFITPDQVGFFVNPNGGDIVMTVSSWYAGT